MTQEALKLALEALEESKTNNDTMEFHDRKNKAIAVVEKALAQTELCKYGQEPASCTSNPMDCQCAIDASLAQTQEPVHNVQSNGRHSPLLTHMMNKQATPPQRTEQEPWCMKMNYCKTKCEDCPDEPPQRTERPVDCERCNRLEEHAYDLIGKLRVANIKLSMQPQRKPLLASSIVTMYSECPTSDNDMIEFARAVEAAHGIKEKI